VAAVSLKKENAPVRNGHNRITLVAEGEPIRARKRGG